MVGVKRPRRQDSVREELQASPSLFVAASWAGGGRALLMLTEVAAPGAGGAVFIEGGVAGLLCCQGNRQRVTSASPF